MRHSPGRQLHERRFWRKVTGLMSRTAIHDLLGWRRILPPRPGLAHARAGRLGLQLALAFVGVAIMAGVAASVVTALTVNTAEGQVLSRQEIMQTNAAALGAAATYIPTGWPRALAPVIAVVDRAGAAARVRDSAGVIVRSSPGFASFRPGPQHDAPVMVGGRQVGLITVRFGDRGIGAILAHFDAQRWRARLIGGSAGALLALAVAVVLGPRITAPVDRLLQAARAMGSGDLEARAGDVRGFGDLRQLAAAFDQMADSLAREEQLRRNMVADISHELRTPIAVLQASTEAMLDGVSELTTDHVQSLRGEVLRLGRMVDDLQRLAAAEAAAIQLTVVPGDLARAAAAAADSLADIFAGKGVTLVRRLDPAPVRCDRRRMHDVITNLLTNAAKFTPPGGQVVLETRRSGATAILRVSDTGTGIRPEDLPRVSERFFRAQNSPGMPGSGIGLAIVEQLVRAHHGTMDITSEPGRGTQVTITLPSR
jgi:signal transduction histidine kinase